jgi:TP901 family phage tail tape measure protein
MAQVAVATDTPVAGLKNLSDLAKQLGADTIFSANEAAQAMLELSKAGIKPAEIEAGALSNTLNLAAASGMALAESAVIMSAGMNTFNLGAKDSTSIVDALAGAANASAADVADIAMALQQTGQQAVASGLTIQETTAALAAFADAGVRGSDAGTSFKTFLQRLNPVSKEAADTMKELGIEFFDSSGNMKDLAGIAGQVQRGFKGLSQEQRLAAMQTIFGSDALRAANILYEEGTDGINKYITATTKSGSAQEMADARMSGLAGALEAMKGSIETAALAIGESLSPTIQDVAGKIQGFANAFSNLSPKMQNVIVKVAVIAAVLGPAILIAGALVTAMGNVAVAIGVVGTAVGWLRTQWVGVAVAEAAAGTAAVAATTIMKRALITTGVGALIVALGYVAAKFYDAANAADDFGKTVDIVQYKTITGARGMTYSIATVVGTLNAAALAASRAADAIDDMNRRKTLQNPLPRLSTPKPVDPFASVTSLSSFSNDMAKASEATGKFKKEISASNKVMDRLNGLLQTQKDKLQTLKDAKKAYAEQVSNAVVQNFSFANSLSKSIDSQNKAADTAKKLQDAQAAYTTALASEDVDRIAEAFKDMQTAQADAADALKNKQSFMQVLRDQATQVVGFTDKVKKLLSMGLNEAGIQQVLAAGAEAGTKIADEIIAGGAGAITEVNALTTSVQSVADSLAASTAGSFFNAGIAQGKALIDGIQQAIKDSGFTISGGKVLLPKDLQKGLDTGKLTAKQIKQLNAILKSGGEIPAMAKGGIVTGPTLALIGEAGPEAVIPLTGNNMPMGATYNISINAGMGADGAVIGREIVDAIKRYERVSGPVFASA